MFNSKKGSIQIFAVLTVVGAFILLGSAISFPPSFQPSPAGMLTSGSGGKTTSTPQVCGCYCGENEKVADEFNDCLVDGKPRKISGDGKNNCAEHTCQCGRSVTSVDIETGKSKTETFFRTVTCAGSAPPKVEEKTCAACAPPAGFDIVGSGCPSKSYSCAGTTCLAKNAKTGATWTGACKDA